MKIKILICIIVGLSSACSFKKENVVTPKLSVQNIDNKGGVCKTQEYFTNPKIVFLETSEKALIGSSIRKIVLEDDRIFIQDQDNKTILMFDTTGRFLAGIYPQGRGAGEYVTLDDFSVDRDRRELVVYASRPNKLLFYDYNCQLKKEVPIEKSFLEIAVGSGEIIGITSWEDPKYYLRRYKILQNGVLEESDITPLPHMNKTGFFAHGVQLSKSERVNFSRRNDPSIYSLEGNTIKKRYEIDFGKYNLPKELSGENVSADKFNQEVLVNSYVFSIVNIKETPKRIFFSILLPGMCILSKDENQLKYYKTFIDSSTHIPLALTEAVEDSGNDVICFKESMMNLKTKVKFLGDKVPGWLSEKVSFAKDDSNPVLFLYRSKE